MYIYISLCVRVIMCMYVYIYICVRVCLCVYMCVCVLKKKLRVRSSTGSMVLVMDPPLVQNTPILWSKCVFKPLFLGGVY